MSLHVTCGRTSYTALAPQGVNLELVPGLDWSETLATAGVTANSVPDAQAPRVLTLVARVDMFVAFGTAPDATVTTSRRLLLSGHRVSYLATPGTKVAWIAA